MPTNYPTGLDNWANPIAATEMDDAGFEHDLVHSNLHDAVEAVEAELGTEPSATYATVKDRLNVFARAAGHLTKTPGFWRGVPNGPTTFIGTGVSLNVLYVAPMWLPESVSFDRIGLNVTTAAASSTARLGVYSSHDTTFRPDALLFDAGTVSTATTGLKEITISQTFGPGIFWLAFITAGSIAVSFFRDTHCPRLVAGGTTQFAPMRAVVITTDSGGTWGSSGLPSPHPTPLEDYALTGPHVSLREV